MLLHEYGCTTRRVAGEFWKNSFETRITCPTWHANNLIWTQDAQFGALVRIEVSNLVQVNGVALYKNKTWLTPGNA